MACNAFRSQAFLGSRSSATKYGCRAVYRSLRYLRSSSAVKTWRTGNWSTRRSFSLSENSNPTPRVTTSTRKDFERVATCPEPTCPCAEIPELPSDKQIDRSGSLRNSAPPVRNHVVIFTGKTDWNSNIALDTDLEGTGGVNVAVEVRKALKCESKHGGGTTPSSEGFMVTNCSFPSPIGRWSAAPIDEENDLQEDAEKTVMDANVEAEKARSAVIAARKLVADRYMRWIDARDACESDRTDETINPSQKQDAERLGSEFFAAIELHQKLKTLSLKSNLIAEDVQSVLQASEFRTEVRRGQWRTLRTASGDFVKTSHYRQRHRFEEKPTNAVEIALFPSATLSRIDPPCDAGIQFFMRSDVVQDHPSIPIEPTSVQNLSQRSIIAIQHLYITSITILICSHGSRDVRCGVLGPLLKTEFEKQLDRLGVKVLDRPRASKVFGLGKDELIKLTVKEAAVGLVSHVGGHKWAGNVMIYFPAASVPQRPEISGEDMPLQNDSMVNGSGPLAGRGVWYGTVEPKHVEGLVKETVLRQRVVDELCRGIITTKEQSTERTDEADQESAPERPKPSSGGQLHLLSNL